MTVRLIQRRTKDRKFFLQLSHKGGKDPKVDSQTDFLLYVGVLGLSGVLLMVLTILGLGSRIVNGLIGLIALGYSGYLVYEYLTMEVFTYTRFIYAYILPIVAVYQLYKGIKDRKAAADAPAATGPGAS